MPIGSLTSMATPRGRLAAALRAEGVIKTRRAADALSSLGLEIPASPLSSVVTAIPTLKRQG